MSSSTQLAVIGAGPGGYAAAFYAADRGMQVTLIDPSPNPGGVCLYRGCIPSKALLHVAEVVNEAKHAGAWGVTFGEPKIDLDKLRAFKTKVVNQLTGGLGQLSKQRKITYVQGTATFKDSRTLEIAREGTQAPDLLTFENAIIATGSHPAKVPGLSIDSPRLMDSTSALDLPDLPKSLLVVGGGYIGLELGTVYAALGSKVTVVEMTGGLLPGADRDLVNVLAKRIEAMCEAVLLNTKVVSIQEQKDGIAVTLERAARSGARPKRRSIAYSFRLAGVQIPLPASRTQKSGWTPAVSSRSTQPGGPRIRKSTQSAISSASRCLRTRRPMKGASRSKRSPARTWLSNPLPFRRSSSRIPRWHGAASRKATRRNRSAR